MIRRLIHKSAFVAGLACVCLSAGVLRADPAETVAPTTRPVERGEGQGEERVAALIADLADPSFAVRDKASEALLAMGDAAMPALKGALKHDDPSIRSYAEYLVRRLEKRNAPPRLNPEVRPGMRIRNPRLGGRLVIGDAVHRAVRVQIQDGVKTTQVTENGRTINIIEGPEGIQVQVTEQRDGKEEKSTYAAKNAEELKEKHPEAFKLYEQHGMRNVLRGGVRIQDGAIQINGGVGAIDIIRRMNRDVLDADFDVQAVGEVGRAVEVIKAQQQQIHEELRRMEQEHRELLEEMRRLARPEPQP